MAAQPNPKYHGRSFADVTGWAFSQPNTPFVIPNLEHDSPNRLVITLELTKYHPSAIVREMYPHACAYWSHTCALAVAAANGDAAAAVELERLVSFPERAEFRSGYTTRGHAGSGIGNGHLGVSVRDSLIHFPGLREGLIQVPDALQLLPQFAGDRVTDALGSIVIADLIRYTQSFVKYFDPGCIRERTWEHAYDGRTGTFDTTIVAEVPVDDHGRPILLLPKDAVKGSLSIDPSDYLACVEVAGKMQRVKLSKDALLQELGMSTEKLVHFAGALLKGVKPHAKFQTDRIERRERRKF